MARSAEMNRRDFLKAGVLVSGVLALSGPMPAFARAEASAPAKDKTHGLKLGMASYTFQKFTLDQAISMTREVDLRYIALKDMHLPLKSTREERVEARKKVEAGGLELVGGGVIYMKNDEAAIREIFDYAKDAGMPTIICSPDVDALDTVEKFAKEYDLRIAIHNHGPGDKKYPSPLDVWKLVQNRDSRMGLCIDVGHTVRAGTDPVEAIHKCATRLYDFHMKDVTEAAAKGKSVEVGKGIIDIPGVLKALIAIKYAYDVALEYEEKPKNPMPGVIGSVAYMRGVLAAI
jgi:sugar phosphate isomerase/epimerase